MESRSEPAPFILASIVGSLLLHAAIFGAYGAYVQFWKPDEVFIENKETEIEESTASETVVIFTSPSVSKSLSDIPEFLVDLPPEVLERMSDEEIEELEKKMEKEQPNAIVQLPSQRFERTSAEQKSSEPIPDTHLYGTQNTLAQSDTKPLLAQGNEPAVKGLNRENSHDIVDSRFQEGKIEDDGGNSQAKAQGKPEGDDLSKLIDEDFNKVLNKITPQDIAAEVKQELEQNTDRVEENLKSKPEPQDQILEVGKEIEKSEEDKLNELKSNEAKASEHERNEQKKASELKEKSTSRKGEVDHSKDPFAVAAGMTSEVKKNRVVGSVHKTGSVASRNVRRSDLGIYESLVYRAIEMTWQKRVREKMDILLPGVVTLSFSVSSKGKILSVVNQGQKAGSGAQLGVTLGAVKEANIPAMPSKVKRQLQGRPLELTMTFNFN